MEPFGGTVGHYRIVGELGRGGMGVVYRAEDLQLGRQVALKALSPEFARNEERVERLRREARSLAALNHPGIVTLYAIEEFDGQLLLSMELVEGQTLDQVVAPGGLDLERFLRLAAALADALSASHDQGIVHRDLKPGNVMVTAAGRLKILDFGLARLRATTDSGAGPPTKDLTEVGAVVGTAAYMAPEQFGGSPADARSDIFSLGILLFEMAAGQHPFRRKTKSSVMASILRDAPPSLLELRPDLPRHLDRILSGCLEKDPERRVQSAKELRNQLERLHEELTSQVVPPPMPPRPLPRRLAAAGLAAVLPLTLLFGIWIVRQRSQRGPPPKLPHLAVTEFRGFSGERGPEYFRRGLIASLGERLAGLDGVWVVPPGKNPVPDLLVEADVQRLSDAVTLQFRILDRKSGRNVGSEILEGNAREPFDLLDHAAEAVAAHLETDLGLPVRYRTGPAPTGDPDAFGLFLKARYGTAGLSERPDPGVALPLLQRALKADPDFAPARVMEGEIHQQRFLDTGHLHALDRATRACGQAVDSDPELAMAHICLARTHQARQRPLEAEKEYLRAIELSPASMEGYNELRALFADLNLPDRAERIWQQVIDLHSGYWAGYWSLGGYYLDTERYAEAAEQYRRALESAPDNAVAQRTLGTALHQLGRYAEAIPAYERSLELAPTCEAYTNLGIVYLLTRQFPEAVASLEKAAQFPEAEQTVFSNLADAYYYWTPRRREEAAAAFERAAAESRESLRRAPADNGARFWLAFDLAMLGRKDESRAVLAEALDRHPETPHASFFAARVLNRLGEREAALDKLQRAVEGGWLLGEIRFSVEFDELRDEPRFQELLDSR